MPVTYEIVEEAHKKWKLGHEHESGHEHQPGHVPVSITGEGGITMPEYIRTQGLTEKQTHYCPGCGHGITHRLVAEVIEELGCLDRAIVVAPVGCAVLATDYFNMDGIQASHGRAPATATGIKRARPECLGFCLSRRW
ncbi:MAG: hypothetical protein LKE29_10045 [Acidaminococcaceae bacterium]|nr:hypothetical protein [Acidaminococcaceae bacterium]